MAEPGCEEFHNGVEEGNNRGQFFVRILIFVSEKEVEVDVEFSAEVLGNLEGSC